MPQNFSGLKIVQLSDFHYGTTVFYDNINHIVDEVNKRNVDLIFFTGDLIDKNYELSLKEKNELINLLKDLNARLGKYAIYGEEDGELFYDIMNHSDFYILDNTYDFIYDNSANPIMVIGSGSSLNGTCDINKSYEYFSNPLNSTNIFSISLIHEPDSVDDILFKHKSNIILAGHSHNGTINIPFFEPAYKVDGALKYNREFYDLDESKLYISSGIGTNGPGFRLFCRPSFNFFRISSS